MLLEFTVGNYRSILEPVTLTLVATKTVSQDKRLDQENVIVLNEDLSVLKSLVLYGANASGKSTLISALSVMRRAILGSPIQLRRARPINPPVFRLRTDGADRPTLFQVVFLIDGIRYQYGFHVRGGTIEQEWLYKTPTTREATLFERDGQNIQVGDLFKEGRGLEERTRAETLFLTTCAAFNVPDADAVVTWFRKLVVQPATRHFPTYAFAARRALESGETREDVLRLITSLDLGITDVEIEEEEQAGAVTGDPSSDMPYIRTGQRIKTVHTVQTPDHELSGVTLFDMLRDESAGTQQLFMLAAPLVLALKHGRIVVIDEFDAHLHPLLTRTLVQLFNSSRTNMLGAQLIFTTHDTNLLDRMLFRRDQVWFTEKDTDAATKLYSLVEFKVRNDASFGANYIRGRYGAVPYFGAFAWRDDTDDPSQSKG
jgi:uncharacterized protein